MIQRDGLQLAVPMDRLPRSWWNLLIARIIVVITVIIRTYS